MREDEETQPVDRPEKRRAAVSDPLDERDTRVVLTRDEQRKVDARLMRGVKPGEAMSDKALLIERDGEGDLTWKTIGELKAAQEPVRTAGGPARVASDAYRSGWDAVFGKRPLAQA